MPPRMTQESYRLQVSDRTLVGTLATVMLAGFGNRRHRRARKMKSQAGREPRRFWRGSNTRLWPELGYSLIERAGSSVGLDARGEIPWHRAGR